MKKMPRICFDPTTINYFPWKNKKNTMDKNDITTQYEI